jgi:hypothetical protein
MKGTPIAFKKPKNGKSLKEITFVVVTAVKKGFDSLTFKNHASYI